MPGGRDAASLKQWYLGRDRNARSQLCRCRNRLIQRREQQVQRPQGRNEHGLFETRKKTVGGEGKRVGDKGKELGIPVPIAASQPQHCEPCGRKTHIGGCPTH